MANKVTATLKSASARAIYVDSLNLKAFVNKEGDVTSITARDEVVSFFGDYTKESFNQKCIKEAKKDNRTYVGLLPDSFITDETKVEMSELEFLNISHVIVDGESKIGLITRTMDYVTATYKFSDDDDNINIGELLVTDSAPKAIEKAVKAECLEKGVYFIRITGQRTESVLVGCEKSDFYKNGKVVR